MRLLLIVGCLCCSPLVWASIDAYEFDTTEQEQLFRELTRELRCPKCQNNSIADSNAEIAKDLREKTYYLVKEGNSKQNVLDYMVDRYGNFVRYDPPLTFAVLMLWLVPLLVIACGIWLLLRLSKGQSVEPVKLDESQQARLDQLLREHDEGSKHD